MVNISDCTRIVKQAWIRLL